MKGVAPRRWFPPLPLAISAVASGLLLVLAYTPRSLGFLSFVALVPMFAACYHRTYPRAAFYKTGYLFGIVFFLGHLWWITFLSAASSITLPWLMAPGLVVLVLYLALYPGLFLLLVRLAAGRSQVAAVLVAPAAWMLTEMLRSSGELGFSWGALGYSLTPYPVLIQGGSLVGVFGVGAVIVLVNMLWSIAVAARGTRRRMTALVAGGAIVLGIVLYGSERIRRFDAGPVKEGHRVAVVQPNVDLHIKWDPAYKDSTLRLIERLTRQSALLGPELVVFPETSAPVFIRNDANFMIGLTNLTRENDICLFIGFLDAHLPGVGEPLQLYNSSGLFYPNGSLSRYNKTHLLPFGESIPLAWKFRALKKINFGQANFDPGKPGKPIASPAGKLAPLICFESIFPGLSRDAVEKGADVLVNITNDGWFGDTPGPSQHADMAIFRAVENGRYLLRSANTGVSMVVDPVGRVLASLGIDEEGILVQTIHEVEGQTPYTRSGDTWAIAGTVLLAVSGTLMGRLTRRST